MLNKRINETNLELILAHFDPSGYNEYFQIEAKAMVESGEYEECLDILGASVGYNVGDDAEFDTAFKSIFSEELSESVVAILDYLK